MKGAWTSQGSAPNSPTRSIEDCGQDTLQDWISGRASLAPSAVALISSFGTIDYAELDRRAAGLATFLVSLGLNKGDVVAAQLPNCVEFVVTYLAAGYAGAVFQTVHMPYRAAEIEPLLGHSGAKIFVCLDRAKDFSPATCALLLCGSLSALSHVISLGDDPPAGAIPFGEALGDVNALTGRKPTSDDLFQLLYTSGTHIGPERRADSI